MYRIKQIPQDFVVKEQNKLEFADNGRYSYFLLKKVDYSTVKAIGVISHKLKIRPKFINFAGTKDKVACTEQYISISLGPRKDYDFGDIQLEYLGRGNERLNLGNLEGNHFEITVRGIDQKPEPKSRVLNLFDDQRFGIKGNNHIIGKHIIKKEFKEAAEMIPLDVKGNDYVGALRTIHKKILLIYVHAFQSYLWNEMAKEIESEEIPILGVGTELEGEIGRAYERLMEREGITQRDFLIRQMPELTSEGDMRKRFIEVENLKIGELEDDELQKGKKCLITFDLTKGAYATNVIKSLFDNH